MADKINLKLTADSLNVTGLTIQDGRLELALTAEIDLDSLECSLRQQLLALAGGRPESSPTAAPVERPVAGDADRSCKYADNAGEEQELRLPPPLPQLSVQSLLDATEPAVALPQEELAEDGLPIPDPVPHEHFFPEPDDENLLAEEALAGYTEEEFFPEPREAATTTARSTTDETDTAEPAAVTGVLFEAELPPAHYFPEPGEELAPLTRDSGEDASTSGSATAGAAVWTEDESLDDDEPIAEDAESCENIASFDEDDNDDDDDDGDAEETDLGWDEEATLDADAPTPPCGESGAADDWSAPSASWAGSDENTTVPSKTGNVADDAPNSEDTFAGESGVVEDNATDDGAGIDNDAGDDGESEAGAIASEDERGAQEQTDAANAEGDSLRSAPSLEDGLGAPQTRYGEPQADIEWSALLGDRHSEAASLTRPVDTDVESHPAFDAPQLHINEPERRDADSDEANAAGLKPAQDHAAQNDVSAGSLIPDAGHIPAEPSIVTGGKKRMPFELINPKLHNAGDAPDDTPPAGDAQAGVQNADALPHERAGAAPRGKSKIKYVCPKCHTPGQQEIDRLGSVVTCANCGRAMRLTMRR